MNNILITVTPNPVKPPNAKQNSSPNKDIKDSAASPTHTKQPHSFIRWLSHPSWQGIGVIVGIIGIIVTVIIALIPSNLTQSDVTLSATSMTLMETVFSTNIPTNSPTLADLLTIPIPSTIPFIQNLYRSSALGDIWTLSTGNSQVTYSDGQNLVVYAPNVINPVTGQPTEAPVAVVRVVNQTDALLFVQVVLKHIDPTKHIASLYQVDDNLLSINESELIPVYDGAVGYFLKNVDKSYVVLRPEAKVNNGDLLQVLLPVLLDNQIIDYLAQSIYLEVINRGVVGAVAEVKFQDNSSTDLQNGDLVITVLPEYTPTPTSASSPTPTPTETSTPSITPTPLPPSGWLEIVSNPFNFYIQVRPVSYSEFKIFAASYDYLSFPADANVQRPEPSLRESDEPYNKVTWYEARAYCEWLMSSETISQSFKSQVQSFALPQLEQWQVASYNQMFQPDSINPEWMAQTEAGIFPILKFDGNRGNTQTISSLFYPDPAMESPVFRCVGIKK